MSWLSYSGNERFTTMQDLSVVIAIEKLTEGLAGIVRRMRTLRPLTRTYLLPKTSVM